MANKYKDMNLVKGFGSLLQRWQLFEAQHPVFVAHLYFAVVFLASATAITL